jgi:hypothetical protein
MFYKSINSRNLEQNRYRKHTLTRPTLKTQPKKNITRYKKKPYEGISTVITKKNTENTNFESVIQLTPFRFFRPLQPIKNRTHTWTKQFLVHS